MVVQRKQALHALHFYAHTWGRLERNDLARYLPWVVQELGVKKGAFDIMNLWVLGAFRWDLRVELKTWDAAIWNLGFWGLS